MLPQFLENTGFRGKKLRVDKNRYRKKMKKGADAVGFPEKGFCLPQEAYGAKIMRYRWGAKYGTAK